MRNMFRELFSWLPQAKARGGKDETVPICSWSYDKLRCRSIGKTKPASELTDLVADDPPVQVYEDEYFRCLLLHRKDWQRFYHCTCSVFWLVIEYRKSEEQPWQPVMVLDELYVSYLRTVLGRSWKFLRKQHEDCDYSED